MPADKAGAWHFTGPFQHSTRFFRHINVRLSLPPELIPLVAAMKRWECCVTTLVQWKWNMWSSQPGGCGWSGNSWERLCCTICRCRYSFQFLSFTFRCWCREWNKRLLSFTTTDEGVTVTFEDGTTATGSLVVGADGSASQTRRILAPEIHALKPLPIRAIGVGVNYTPEQMTPLLKLDPFLFQAIHPKTNDFLWWSGKYLQLLQP